MGQEHWQLFHKSHFHKVKYRVVPILFTIVFGAGAFLILNLIQTTSDLLQAQTEWEGYFTQNGMPHKMFMHIIDRKGNEISGELHWKLDWPPVDAKTVFMGRILDKQISFTEYKLIQGRGISIPTLYLGKLSNSTIKGTWLNTVGGHVASGVFEINKVSR